MESKDSFNEFLKAFKIALNNAGVYFAEHPFFKQSVQTLQEKISLLFNQSYSIEIGISPNSLLFNDEYFKDDIAHKDLAAHFHRRMVSKITINKTVSVNELVSFLSVVSMPVKDLIAAGGFNKLLMQNQITNISIDELDYTQLLHSTEGDEGKDLWKFVINGVTGTRGETDQKKVNEVANNFSKIVKTFNAKDIKEDPNILKNMIKVASNLKANNDEEKFKEVSKEIVGFLLREKELIADDKLVSEIKDLFKDVDSSTLGDSLFEKEVVTKKLDPMVLEFFSKMLDFKKQQDMAEHVSKKAENAVNLHNDKAAQEKINNLFTTFDNKFISSAYKNMLKSFVRISAEESNLSYDPQTVTKHYNYLLVNLFNLEQKTDFVLSLAESQWQKIIEDGDFEMLKKFYLAINTAIENNSKNDKFLKFYQENQEKILEMVKKNMADNMDKFSDEDFMFFLDKLPMDKEDSYEYIRKIDVDDPSYLDALRIFMNLFPSYVDGIYSILKKKCKDIKTARDIISTLSECDSLGSVFCLKHIYSIVNPILKVDIIKTMDRLTEKDMDFIFDVLKNGGFFPKREAVKMLLSQPEEAQKKAAHILLVFFNPLGFRNRLLMENLRIVEAGNLYNSLDVLRELNNKFFFFWEKAVKDKIKQLIERFSDAK